MTKNSVIDNTSKTQTTKAIYKKIWAHKLLLTISITMLVIAIAGMIFCIINITKVNSLIELGLNEIESIAIYSGILILGLIGVILLIPPAIIGILIYAKPNFAIIGIVLGAIAVAIVLIYFCFALFSGDVSLFATYGYTGILAILPVIYLICTIKIQTYNKNKQK